MNNKIKTWQTEPNNYHYTKEPLYCDICKKQVRCVFQIEDTFIGSACCFNVETINQILEDKEYFLMRFIEDILYDKRKNIIKKERGILTLKLRYQIFKRDNFRCVLCGVTSKESKLEIDHIIPISKGGKTIKSNLRTLCFNCNRGKGNESEN